MTKPNTQQKVNNPADSPANPGDSVDGKAGSAATSAAPDAEAKAAAEAEAKAKADAEADAKTKASAKPKTVKALRIRAPHDRYRRAGLIWTQKAIDIPLAKLKKEQIDRLRADKLLKVRDVEIEVSE